MLAHTPDTAGWSSPVARQAHNLKVAGSNPAPATNAHEHTHQPTDIITDDRKPAGHHARGPFDVHAAPTDQTAHRHSDPLA